MFICSFICYDFDNGILKNIISRGYSRQSIFTAKFMAVIVMVILNLVAVFAVSSALYHNIGSIYALFIPQLIILVFGLISFAGIFFMLCSIFKKSAPTIVVSLLALLALPTGISIISSYLHINLSCLWLGNAVSTLAVNNISVQTLLASGVCIIVYLVVSYIVSISVVKKLEV